MRELPLVTIGVVSYNNARFTTETLNSVANQTYENIELIIVDDNSFDNSVELINKWLLNYHKPYKFITHDKNLGVCATCNDVLRNSNGRYISYISTDDVMLPDKTKVQVNILEGASQDVGIVYSDAYIINENGKLHFNKFIQYHRNFEDIPQGNIFTTLIEGNFIPIMASLIKRECYETCGEYDTDLVYEDYDFLLRVSRKYEFVFSDYTSVQYRLHSTNLHKKLASMVAMETQFKIFAKHAGYSLGTDKIIKTELHKLLLLLYENKYHKINKLFTTYIRLYKDNKMMHRFVKYGVGYNKFIIFRNIYNWMLRIVNHD